MREPEVISAYVADIADKLDFDPSLSRRVRQEVEEHLWESMSASSTTNGFMTAQAVIARFGDAQTLAAEFATVWLAEQARKFLSLPCLLRA